MKTWQVLLTKLSTSPVGSQTDIGRCEQSSFELKQKLTLRMAMMTKAMTITTMIMTVPMMTSHLHASLGRRDEGKGQPAFHLFINHQSLIIIIEASSSIVKCSSEHILSSLSS